MLIPIYPSECWTPFSYATLYVLDNESTFEALRLCIHGTLQYSGTVRGRSVVYNRHFGRFGGIGVPLKWLGCRTGGVLVSIEYESGEGFVPLLF